MLLLTHHQWSGAEHLDVDGGVIVAPNHISWFDPLVTAHFLFDNDRPPRFLAKDAVFRVPVLGRLIRNAGQIPVMRDTVDAARSVAAGVEALERGECVVVYPEGTITRDPELWPMSGKTGAARLALMTGAPLLPMAQWGAQHVMAPYSWRLRLLPPKTVRVVLAPPVGLDDLRSLPIDADTLRIATERLMEAITAALEEVRGGKPPLRRMNFHGSREQRGPKSNEARTRRSGT
jgi:1-acyl-sn-glycerol-3-phosphate acyltransferase